ncbi:hypothetical protein ATCC90586_004968 [Pythium insidiosum]|nr:hypothetical protein ATCC90586_004968 [Pythium insidiosum]
MDATRFTSLHHPDGGRSDASGPGFLAYLPSKDMALDAVQTVSTWTTAAFMQCFSRISRRPHFDEEHQRSLLSCHSAEDDLPGHDDEAMRELRRRVQQVDLTMPRRPTFAQELEATYNRHKALVQRSTSSPAADALPPSARRRDKSPSDPLPLREYDAATRADAGSKSELEIVDDIGRLSVDELLALRMPSPVAEDAAAATESSVEAPEELSEDAQALRRWLEGVDTARSADYASYARMFEQQGFHNLDDLAQLDESDVEQAMSEVGITKFAHRARIRKAILRLRQDVAASKLDVIECSDPVTAVSTTATVSVVAAAAH